MEENQEFDLEEIVEEVSSRIEDIVEDILQNCVEDAITCALQDALPETLSESFLDFDFILPNGTIVRPRQYMKLLSPDKSKLLLCYGGLRVDGSTLMVQTRVASWEGIASYQNREEAVEALLKVKNAMELNLTSFEL